MIVTDDYCAEATQDIMDIMTGEIDIFNSDMMDDKWITIYDKVFSLLADRFESNGYVNHN